MQKKCYKLVTTPFGANWDVADAGCKSIGGELAPIESQCEQETVFEVSHGLEEMTKQPREPLSGQMEQSFTRAVQLFLVYFLSYQQLVSTLLLRLFNTVSH